MIQNKCQIRARQFTNSSLNPVRYHLAAEAWNIPSGYSNLMLLCDLTMYDLLSKDGLYTGFYKDYGFTLKSPALVR